MKKELSREKLAERCRKVASRIRQDAVELTYSLGHTGAHIGGALSLAEIMAVLYCGVLNITPDTVQDEKRDRLIFSKGHGTLALYPAMMYAGLLTREELNTYKQNETFLYAHPSMNRARGIEFSSGSLGQGLSLGVGCALALQRKHNDTSKVYVVLGDGECDEGSVWEAAQSAAHYRCRNLIAVIDQNGLQYDGPKEQIMGISSFAKVWEGFGWKTCEVDGHDVNTLLEAFSKAEDGPWAIIAHTVKGKGVSFMENDALWHNHSLTERQYLEAMSELRGEEGACL